MAWRHPPGQIGNNNNNNNSAIIIKAAAASLKIFQRK